MQPPKTIRLTVDSISYEYRLVDKTHRRVVKQTSDRQTWLTPYFDVWKEVYPDGEVPVGKLSKYIRPLDIKHGPDKVVPQLKYYLKTSDKKYLNLSKFADFFGSWKNQEGPAEQEDCLWRSRK